jgi:hypothetical protein
MPLGNGAGHGRAADGFGQESGVVGAHVTALDEHDQAGDRQMRDALAASGIGRERMDSVIAAAVADVTAMGASTSTPQGQRALVAAIKRHLEDTKSTLDGADGDASTRAAGAHVTAAGYDGLGAPPAGGGPGMPQLPTMPSIPPVPQFGSALSGSPLAALGGLGGLFAPGGQSGGTHGATPASAIDSGPTSGASAIPVGDVRFDRNGFAGGPGAYRGYIAKALDLMGITDPAARENWTRGLQTGLSRESGFNPLAVNRSDSNAHGAILTDGAPAGSSRGGLQNIPATFASNHQPGTSTNIYDPVANTASTINYLMRRYHVLRDGSNLSAVPQFNPHHSPQGF